MPKLARSNKQRTRTPTPLPSGKRGRWQTNRGGMPPPRLDLQMKRGDRPLHLALRHGAEAAVVRLLAEASGPNLVKMRDCDGRLPLHVAIAAARGWEAESAERDGGGGGGKAMLQAETEAGAGKGAGVGKDTGCVAGEGRPGGLVPLYPPSLLSLLLSYHPAAAAARTTEGHTGLTLALSTRPGSDEEEDEFLVEMLLGTTRSSHQLAAKAGRDGVLPVLVALRQAGVRHSRRVIGM